MPPNLNVASVVSTIIGVLQRADTETLQLFIKFLRKASRSPDPNRFLKETLEKALADSETTIDISVR